MLADNTLQNTFRGGVPARQIQELLYRTHAPPIDRTIRDGFVGVTEKSTVARDGGEGAAEKTHGRHDTPISPNRVPPVGGPGILQSTRLQWRRWLFVGTAAAAVVVIAVWMSVHRFRNGETIGPLAASTATQCEIGRRGGDAHSDGRRRVVQGAAIDTWAIIAKSESE